MSGKGSAPRPLSVPRTEYDRRWQDTFAPLARLTPREMNKALDEAMEEYLRGRAPEAPGTASTDKASQNEVRTGSTQPEGESEVGAPTGAPLWPDIYEQTRIGNGTLTHHPLGDCAGHHCCIHNPSVHAMNDFPLHWRGDRGLMERICEHGVGHVDFDHIEYVRRTLGDEEARLVAIHGCDGCCGGDS